MPRYYSERGKISDYWIEDRPTGPLPHPTVFLPEPTKTGLYDADGNPIYRLPDVVGFLKTDEGRD